MTDFRDKVTNGAYFSELIRLALPGASAREVQAAFGPKADLRELANWKSGKRWPADWAVELLVARWRQRVALGETVAARLRSGPGRKGNRANLKPFRQAA